MTIGLTDTIRNKVNSLFNFDSQQQSNQLKNKIDNLWDIFASGGLVNPLEVIEQITYLMFIHDLDDSDNTRAKESAMLGLPYQSIFSEEVKIGERTIDGSQLKWSVSMISRRTECIR